MAAPGAADVVGARVVLTVGGRKVIQYQKGGGSYLSARDSRLLFGLAKDKTAGTLTVHWPTGEPRSETWEGLEVDRYHKLEQGKSKKG